MEEALVPRHRRLLVEFKFCKFLDFRPVSLFRCQLGHRQAGRSNRVSFLGVGPFCITHPTLLSTRRVSADGRARRRNLCRVFRRQRRRHDQD